jgi:hypothetical protein
LPIYPRHPEVLGPRPRLDGSTARLLQQPGRSSFEARESAHLRMTGLRLCQLSGVILE